MENIFNHGITIEANGEDCSVTFSPNATLHVNVDTIPFKQFKYVQKFSLTENNVTYKIGTKEKLDFKTPFDTVKFTCERNINQIDVDNIKHQEFMPGYRFKWYYSGGEVKADKLYRNTAFIRNISKILRLMQNIKILTFIECCTCLENILGLQTYF